jgi:biopolymer transport protein ExbD
VESLSTNVDNVTSSDTPTQEKRVNLAVTIFPNRVELSADEKTQTVSIRNGEVDTVYLTRILEYWRQLYPDRKDVVLNTENQVPYRHMIQVFDTLVGNGWPDVGVNTQ